MPLLASICDDHPLALYLQLQLGHGGGVAAVLGCAGGVPAGGAGQLPRRLHGRLQRLARRLRALLWQRMLKYAG